MAIKDFERHEHSVRMTMRMLEDSYMTAVELDELRVIANNLRDLERKVRAARVNEQHAQYPLNQPGRPFRTLSPTGRCAYFETVTEAVEHAVKRSKALTTAGKQSTVMLTESWAARSVGQDPLNEGWSMFGAAEDGTYKGPDPKTYQR